LLRENGVQNGVLVFAPVYNGHRTNPPASRYEMLRGFVLGVFRVNDLLDLATAQLAPAGLDIE